MAPFANDIQLELLRKHRIQLIFGGESYLPNNFCGLAWSKSISTKDDSVDYFLQLDITRISNQRISLEELSKKSSEAHSNRDSWVICGGSTCDGRFFLSPLKTAQKIAKDFFAIHEGHVTNVIREQKVNKTCTQACQFPGKLLLSEGDRLDLKKRVLSANKTEVPIYYISFTSKVIESLFGISNSESNIVYDDDQDDRLKLSDFTQVTSKYVADEKYCVMQWPLNNSEIFLLDRSFDYYPSSRLEVLTVLITCTLPEAMTEAIFRIDFYNDKELLPYGLTTTLKRDAFWSLVIHANLPPLEEMNLDPGHASTVISIIDPTDSTVLASLSANLLFSFGSSSLQSHQRQEDIHKPPIDFHNQMYRLQREDLFALLNAMNLTGVALEVGVCEGLFASNMLKNWRGERSSKIIVT